LIINSLIKRASVYHQQEQVEKSYEDLKRAENIDPNSSEVFHHRAQVIIIIKLNYDKFMIDTYDENMSFRFIY